MANPHSRRWFLAALASAATGSAEWSRFRGPNGSGVDDSGDFPAAISRESGLRWRTPLAGGRSSPALAGDRIFLTAAEANDLTTLALDRASGRVRWKRSIERRRDERKHRLNHAASASPASDGENVYCFFGDYGLVSYGADGGERWRLPLGPFSNLHGMASSPMLAGGKLVMLCDQDTDSYLLALDKDTGEELWRTPRPEAVHGFSTPTLFQPADDIEQLIVPGSYELASYAVEDGRKLWHVRGITWQVKTCAVVDEDAVYMTGWAPGADAGKRRFFPPYEEVIGPADKDDDGKLSPEEIPEEMRHTGSWQAIDLDHDGFMDARDWGFYRARWSSRNVTLAVRPQAGRGDLTERIQWEYERGVPVVSSPLLYRGRLYTIKDGGILTVFEAKSGQVLHQGRLRDAIDKYYASPVAGGGKVYFFSETGKASVLDAGDLSTLSISELGEACYATPALSDGMLYLRTAQALYAFS